MSLTLRDRKKIITCVPWIKEIEPNLDCEAKTTANKPCKLFARWQFKSLAGKVSHFCFQHLIYTGIQGTMEDDERFNRWWKRNHNRFLPPDDSAVRVEPPE